MVRELADQPEVEVSVGLVAKVKQTLLQESYAIEHDRLLYLRDPLALLATWAERYRGPDEQISLYVRGDQEAAERVVDDGPRPYTSVCAGWLVGCLAIGAGGATQGCIGLRRKSRL